MQVFKNAVTAENSRYFTLLKAKLLHETQPLKWAVGIEIPTGHPRTGTGPTPTSERGGRHCQLPICFRERGRGGSGIRDSMSQFEALPGASKEFWVFLG